jgi:lipopolysaccharide/colanic/teichoic acid biosynthesis glycosyltransferase
MLKRLLDLFLSGAAVLALSPLLVPVMILLRLTGEGEVFFRQQRIGRGGQPFGILKFATMLKNSPNMSGGDITVGNDPRILPFGGFLRKTKINELPQLFNVLLGDMSLIGPRPLTPRVANMFPPEHWAQVGHLRPGLSGIGSIVFRDEEGLLSRANDRETVYREIIVPYKSALECWYAQRESVGLDIKLILFTLRAVLDKEFRVTRHLPDLPGEPPALAALRHN